MKTETATGPKVYGAIAAVMADLAAEGITKSRKNQQQGYNFRGIDDVYNALSPFLAKHGLVMLPKVLNRETVERATKAGGALFYVTVEMEFALVAASDGSTHTVQTYGEAMDSGDKATNKAMSAAYKYAAMQTFCIPTEGDNDADATTHEVKAENKPPANGLGTEKRDTGPGSVAGLDWWGAEGSGASPAAAKRDEAMVEAAAAARTAFRDAEHDADWHKAVADFSDQIRPMPRAWRSLLRDEADTAADRLNIFPADRKPK